MLLDNLPHECTIQKRTHSKGSLGGRTTALTTISTGVSCWEQSVSSNEAIQYQKEGTVDLRKVYFSSKPNVNTRYHIIITKRNGVSVSSANQETLEVIGEPEPDASAGKQILFKAMCRLITQEQS